MPVICELRDDIKEYLEARKLFKKWEKAKKLFEKNPEYPSFTKNNSQDHRSSPENVPILLVGGLYVHSGDGEICDRKMRHSRWRGYRSLNKISSLERRII